MLLALRVDRCSLETLEPNPVSGEFYLTEIPEQLLRTGGSVEVVAAVPPEDVLSINTPDQLAEVDAILQELREIEGILMIWMGSAEHPMMWSPPGLTEKLSSLSGAVNSGDARPTESMYAVFEDLTERFELQSKRLHQIID